MALSKLDAIIAEAVTNQKIPGVVVAVSDRKGLIYEGAAGVRALGRPEPMTLDSLFWIASMTKAITSTAALQCVERGLLSLDAPAAEILPALGDVKVLEGFDAGGQPRLRAPKLPVTLRHLLAHTAGFGYEFSSPDIKRFAETAKLPGFTACTRAGLGTPLLFDPGERCEYGINIDYAGLMIEAATGLSLGGYFAEHITGPLGMTSTSFRPSAALRAKRVGIHARATDGSLSPMIVDLPEDPEVEMGGSGLFGTPADYLRFTRMILNGGAVDGRRYLSAESVALMSTNQIGALSCCSFETAMPEWVNSVPAVPGMPMHWGLGFSINGVAFPGGRAANSLSWAGIANTYYWIDPTNGITVAVGTQILPFFDAHVIEMLGAIEAAVYAAR